jgi:hypothetical protein
VLFGHTHGQIACYADHELQRIQNVKQKTEYRGLFCFVFPTATQINARDIAYSFACTLNGPSLVWSLQRTAKAHTLFFLMEHTL